VKIIIVKLKKKKTCKNSKFFLIFFNNPNANGKILFVEGIRVILTSGWHTEISLQLSIDLIQLTWHISIYFLSQRSL